MCIREPYDAAKKGDLSATLIKYRAHSASVTNVANNTARKIIGVIVFECLFIIPQYSHSKLVKQKMFQIREESTILKEDDLADLR